MHDVDVVFIAQSGNMQEGPRIVLAQPERLDRMARYLEHLSHFGAWQTQKIREYAHPLWIEARD